MINRKMFCKSAPALVDRQTESVHLLAAEAGRAGDDEVASVTMSRGVTSSADVSGSTQQYMQTSYQRN